MPQITMKVLSSIPIKHRQEFAPVYFSSTVKTGIRPEDSINKSFQEVFNRIDNWISEGSGRIIKSTDVEYVVVSL